MKAKLIKIVGGIALGVALLVLGAANDRAQGGFAPRI